MTRYARSCLLAAVCAALVVAAARAQEPPVQAPEPRPKLVIDFRWLESKQIEGVTQVRGWVRVSCGPEYMFPHKTPVLTVKDVTRAELCKADLSCSGLPSNMYMVTFYFTDEAKKKLAAECADGVTRPIAAFADGRTAGMRYFDRAKADEFVCQIGFLTSRTEAERIVAACK